jgi:hypothetical protein
VSGCSSRRQWTSTNLSSVRTQLLMLHDFLERNPKSSSNPKSGLINNGSASASFPVKLAANGPNGQHIESSNRDCGFKRVITQTHDPVKVTIFTSSPPPQNFANPANIAMNSELFPFSPMHNQGSRKCVSFFYDILVYSESFETHVQHLQ